jgi:hypothetical protein
MLKTNTLPAPERNPTRNRSYCGYTSSVISAAPAPYLAQPRRSLRAVAFTLSLTVVLSACALYDTTAKAGSHTSADDEKITAEVRSQFKQHLELESNALRVQTRDHVVYLNGLVASSLEIDTAEAIARQVPGVTRVVSAIDHDD